MTVNNAAMHDEELKQQVKSVLLDCEYDSQRVFQWCVEETSYWTQNEGRMKVFKDANKMWTTEIWENNRAITQCKSTDKNVSMIGACMLLAYTRRVEVPVEFLENFS
jgi:hypothetical protein